MAKYTGARIVERMSQVLGIGLAITTLFCVDAQMRFVKTATETEGRVLRNIRAGGRDGSPMYRAVVEYTRPEGGKGMFTSKFSTRPAAFQPGESVRVLIGAPGTEGATGSKVEIKGFLSLWFPSLFLGIFTLIFGSVGAVLPLLRIRKVRSAGYVPEADDPIRVA